MISVSQALNSHIFQLYYILCNLGYTTLCLKTQKLQKQWVKGPRIPLQSFCPAEKRATSPVLLQAENTGALLGLPSQQPSLISPQTAVSSPQSSLLLCLNSPVPFLKYRDQNCIHNTSDGCAKVLGVLSLARCSSNSFYTSPPSLIALHLQDREQFTILHSGIQIKCITR